MNQSISEKDIKHLLWLYAMNQNGKSCMMATPQGNLYTQKAYDNNISLAITTDRKELIKKIENINWHEDFSGGLCSGYLLRSDVLRILKKEK